MKICCHCKKPKDLSEFHAKSSAKDGKHPQCKSCRAEYSLINKDKIAQSWKTFSQENKEFLKAYDSKRAKDNPQKYAAKAAKRRAVKLLATPKWLNKTHFNQIQIFYDSAAALTKEFGIPMEVDHIVPLQGENVSGLHVPWNLQVIPEYDNLSKGNKF